MENWEYGPVQQPHKQCLEKLLITHGNRVKRWLAGSDLNGNLIRYDLITQRNINAKFDEKRNNLKVMRC